MGFNSGFKGLKLKFRKNKNYNEKRTTHLDIVTSLLLKLLK